MKIQLLTIIFLVSVSFTSKHDKAVDPWVKYVSPAEFHQLLKKYTGKWNVEISMWMNSTQPKVIKASSTNIMEFGDRFLQVKQNGLMMGMPYENATTIGYNRASEKVELTSFTNMGTGMLYLSGSYDKLTNKATVSGQMANPTGGEDIMVKQVISFGNDYLIIENYDKRENTPEKKTMQYKLTRKL